MTPAERGDGPALTFFVELAEEPLAELFARPEVVPFLAGGGHAVSMGLLDLSPRRAEIVRRLESQGVAVTGWLLLDVAEGYWLNADNPGPARSRWRATRDWAEREGLRLHRIGLDVEFPRSESQRVLHDQRGAWLSMLRRRRPREQVRAAEAAYAELVDEIHASGRQAEAYHFPHLLDERAVGSSLLRRALGLVELPADFEVFMLYSTYLGHAAARSYFADAPGIALGVTGGGVNASEPEARRRHLEWDALEADLRAAAPHRRPLYVFSLEGCVWRGWLPRFREIRWDAPPPPAPARERRRAACTRRLARWTFRAEPWLDRLLPPRRPS